MKLRFVLSAFVATAALFAAGCTEKQANASVQAGEGEVTSVLLTDETGIDDGSFNAAAWRGILEFYGETWGNTPGRGRLFQTITAQTPDFYVPNLNTAVDEGFDLIIATGFTWADALTEVAKANPNQKFLIVDVDGIGLPNVMQAVFAEHEGSYLVGAAAALQALEDGVQNPRFGFIGGIAGSLITKFHVGYVQGVRSIIPDADVPDFYVNSWGEPALAQTQAMNWYDNGVYAIFSAAGNSGSGTIAQAREQRLAGKNVWAIGVDSDQVELGRLIPNDSTSESAVLTSMVKMVESGVIYALEAVRDGNFDGRSVTFDLSMDGVSFATSNPALSPAVVERLTQIRQQIINGNIVVEQTLAGAMKNPDFPRNLSAIDG